MSRYLPSLTSPGDAQKYFQAAHQNQAVEVQAMLDTRPDLIGKTDENRWTALHYAVQGQALEVVELLIERGVDLNAQGVVGETALHLTSHLELVRILVAAGGESEIEDSGGVSALDWAVTERDAKLFLALAESAPVLYSPTFLFLNALHRAELSLECSYRGQFRSLSVERLGWRNGQEYCQGWQFTGSDDLPQRGWNCYAVSEMAPVDFGDPVSDFGDYDYWTRPKGVFSEIYPYSLPGSWLLIESDEAFLEGVYDCLEGEELDVRCCRGPGEARKWITQEKYHGVIGNARSASVMRDLRSGKLKSPGMDPAKIMLVLSESSGLEDIPHLLHIDRHLGANGFVDQLMAFLA